MAVDRFKKLLFDTNIWLDYFLARDGREKTILELMEAVETHECSICTASTSLKDIFFIIPASLKRQAHISGGHADEGVGATCNEIAWSCIRQVMELSQIVSIGRAECFDARIMRPLHGDFEDNALVAAVQNNRVDYLVTQDRALAIHAPVKCVTPEQMLEIFSLTSRLDTEP